MTIFPERDMYRLVMRSKLPTAECFEEWGVGEVLPSIRKNGEYPSNPSLPTNTNPRDTGHIKVLFGHCFCFWFVRGSGIQRLHLICYVFKLGVDVSVNEAQSA